LASETPTATIEIHRTDGLRLFIDSAFWFVAYTEPTLYFCPAFCTHLGPGLQGTTGDVAG